MKITQEQKDLLIGTIKTAIDKLDMDESMEHREDFQDILREVNNILILAKKVGMFKTLNSKEKQEFIDVVNEDEKFQNTLKYLSLCHPITRQEFVRQIRIL